MSRRSQKPGGSRQLSLGTLVVVLVLLGVIYWQTGSLPTEVLDAVLGEEGAVTVLTEDAPTDAPTRAAQVAPTQDAPTAVPAQTVTQPPATATATPQQTRGPTVTPQRSRSGLPTIAFADLPVQAQETIALIDAGGPFPFSRDDTIFQNRERLLPLREQGYYHEYTVITPGSPDRGARRIVAGSDGELYYTDDHYDSFREVFR
ncbi:hypothetical protein GC175_09435 [bacterium]|nr:hypothetical protein [bacterium]